MEDTTATRETDRQLAGEALVITDTAAKAIVFGGTYITVEEIAFARHGNNADIANGEEIVQGCWIEFKRKGRIFIPGLTPEGLGALVRGDVF
jgi:hypothetical protein